jgi:hypothetical protein
MLDHLGPSTTSVPTTQRLPRTPPYGYKDFSYATGDTAATVTYKDPLANNLKRPTPLPRTWAEFQSKPEQYLHHPTWDLLSPAKFYETVRDWDWNDIDGHTPTATMRVEEWLTSPKQRVLPPKKQRVPDASDQAQQMRPTKCNKLTIGFNTMTPAAYNMWVKSHDINNQSHQPTAKRPTWEDERVPAQVQNLKIDGDQSFQTTAEKGPNRKLMR